VQDLQVVIDYCYDNSIITTSCYKAVTDIHSQFSSDISSLTNIIKDCTAVSRIFDEIVLEALCTSGFSGIYHLWVYQFVIAIALFLLVCLGGAVIRFHMWFPPPIDDLQLEFNFEAERGSEDKANVDESNVKDDDAVGDGNADVIGDAGL